MGGEGGGGGPNAQGYQLGPTIWMFCLHGALSR